MSPALSAALLPALDFSSPSFAVFPAFPGSKLSKLVAFKRRLDCVAQGTSSFRELHPIILRNLLHNGNEESTHKREPNKCTSVIKLPDCPRVTGALASVLTNVMSIQNS